MNLVYIQEQFDELNIQFSSLFTLLSRFIFEKCLIPTPLPLMIIPPGTLIAVWYAFNGFNPLLIHCFFVPANHSNSTTTSHPASFRWRMAPYREWDNGTWNPGGESIQPTAYHQRGGSNPQSLGFGDQGFDSTGRNIFGVRRWRWGDCWSTIQKAVQWGFLIVGWGELWLLESFHWNSASFKESPEDPFNRDVPESPPPAPLVSSCPCRFCQAPQDEDDDEEEEEEDEDEEEEESDSGFILSQAEEGEDESTEEGYTSDEILNIVD